MKGESNEYIIIELSYDAYRERKIKNVIRVSVRCVKLEFSESLTSQS
jgi:hypothetical protein